MALLTTAGRRLAWLPLGLSAVIGLTGLVLEWLDSSAGSVADPLSVGLILTYAFVGGLILRREPTNAVGWLLGAFSLIMTLAFADGRYVIAAFDGRVRLPGAELAAAMAWLWQVGLACPVLIAILVPTGRPASRMWGRVLGAVVALFAFVAILFAIGPPTVSVTGSEASSIPNPFYVPAAQPVYELVQSAFIIYIGVFAVGAIALLDRFRRSRGRERQQLKWILAGIVAMIAGLAASNLLPGLPGQAAFAAAMVPLPASTGVAMLRYRLYDIDRIISRTVAYAIVSGLLAACYGLAFLGLQAILAPFVENDGPLVAVSTLVAFALFAPLRRRISSLVDRRFNRARYDGEREADAFAARVRDDVEVAHVAAALDAALARTVQPASAALWVRSTDAP